MVDTWLGVWIHFLTDAPNFSGKWGSHRLKTSGPDRVIGLDHITIHPIICIKLLEPITSEIRLWFRSLWTDGSKLRSGTPRSQRAGQRRFGRFSSGPPTKLAKSSTEEFCIRYRYVRKLRTNSSNFFFAFFLFTFVIIFCYTRTNNCLGY